MIANMIEKIEENGRLLCLIIRSNYSEDGITFFTPKEFSQQLGYMKRPIGYTVQPHFHNHISRDVSLTQEVLFIKTGSLIMSIYREDRTLYYETIMYAGDVVLLAEGGHSFHMLEETEIIEVKTGPHVGDIDKTRFEIK